jgi:replicative DNA helicase
LANSVPTTANTDYYIGILQEKALHRKAIVELRRQMQAAMQVERVSELITGMKAGTDALEDAAVTKKDFVTISDVALEVFDRTETVYNNRQSGIKVTGIPSGFTDLDDLTSGFQRSDLIIVAARPSVGKTAFALNVAQNAGFVQPEPVAIFSLEMGAAQLVQRMISANGCINATSLRNGEMMAKDWENLTLSIGSLSNCNILIDDSPTITVNEIRAKCRKLKRERGLSMILIDYIQLISGSGKGKENRQQEVSEISRKLKHLARELDVPVVALSQLSRGVEQRQDKRPMMSDLRESGSLEQDADIVAFLYRDDYYNRESERKNIIEVIVAKQRNGPVGTVELAFLKHINKFVDLDRRHQEAAAGRPIPDMYRGAQ